MKEEFVVSELNVRLEMIAQQRNAALNDAAVLAARCHLQLQQIEALTKRVAELEPAPEPAG